MELKQKQHPVVDGTGDRSMVQCCKEQYCIGTWNVRSIYASKVMIRILQARLQQYVNWNFQMFKLGLEKAEEPKIKLSTFAGLEKKQENFTKHILLLH